MRDTSLARGLTLAACAAALVALAARPASAGWWQVTYNTTGCYTSGGWNGTGASWESHPQPYPGGGGWVEVLGGQPYPSYMDGGAVGTVGATLDWIPDPDKTIVTDPPPEKVSFTESVSVGADLMFSDLPMNSLDTFAYNGFGDPVVTTPSGGAFCDGSHSFCLDGSSGHVEVRPVVLFVSALAVDPETWCAVLSDARIKIELNDIYVQAYSTDRPAGNETGLKPTFFSGTGCFAEAGVTSFTPGVSYAKLDVNGEVLIEKHYEQPNSACTHQSGYFQSNHWGDGTPLRVTYTVIDTHGTVHSASVSAPAYNKALDLAHSVEDFIDEGPRVLAAVAAPLARMRHSVVQSLQYDRTAIVNALPPYTVFHIATHGDSEVFLDCVHPHVDNSPYNIGVADVSVSVDTKTEWWHDPSPPHADYPVGSEYPPFNLVVLHACSTLGRGEGDESLDPALAWSFRVLKPITRMQDEQPVDRACIGWRYPISIADLSSWAKSFYACLEAGHTITWANLAGHLSTRVDGIANILGDPAMTLNCVYGLPDGFGETLNPTWRNPDYNF